MSILQLVYIILLLMHWIRLHQFLFIKISVIWLKWRAATPAGKVCPGVTPQRAKANEEAHGPPAKSVCLKRKSTVSMFLKCSCYFMNYEIDSLLKKQTW